MERDRERGTERHRRRESHCEPFAPTLSQKPQLFLHVCPWSETYTQPKRTRIVFPSFVTKTSRELFQGDVIHNIS